MIELWNLTEKYSCHLIYVSISHKYSVHDWCCSALLGK